MLHSDQGRTREMIFWGSPSGVFPSNCEDKDWFVFSRPGRGVNTCQMYAACTLTRTPPLQGVNQPDDTLIFIAHQGGDLEVCRPVGEEGMVCMSNHSSNAAYRKKLQNTEALCHQIFPLAPHFPQLPDLPQGQLFGSARRLGHITSRALWLVTCQPVR